MLLSLYNLFYACVTDLVWTSALETFTLYLHVLTLLDTVTVPLDEQSPSSRDGYTTFGEKEQIIFLLFSTGMNH